MKQPVSEETEKQLQEEYHNVQEYLEELSLWGRNWIHLYSKFTVELSQTGELSGIKGKLLFQKELEKLCQPDFTKEEEEGYQRNIQIFLGWMEEIHKKSRQYIKSGGMIPMEYLHHIFQLDAFEWYLFCMAFLLEIDTQFERIFVLLQDDYQKKAPTLELCIRMFTLKKQEQSILRQRIMEHWEFLKQFFEVEYFEKEKNEESIFHVPLILDRRLVSFIYDMESQDPVFQKTVTFHLPVQMEQPLIIRQEKVELLEKMYDFSKKEHFLYISGSVDMGKKFLVSHLCKRKKKPVLFVDTKNFFKLDYPIHWLLKRLQRESILKGNAMICFTDISIENVQGERESQVLEEILSGWEGSDVIPIFTSHHSWKEGIPTSGRVCMELHLEELSLKERKTFWEALLSGQEEKSCVNISQLAGTYILSPGAIERVYQEVMTRRQLENGKEDLEKQLYQGCQKQLVHTLGKDAVQISTQYTMEDLILPQSQKKLLQDACNMVKYHHFVFEDWGFHEKMAYGKGVSMIFYGPPGTGKTMGAQAIANQLNLELYRVDMASVLSKYIGESEKKLGNIFEQGAKSQSILFFDEADALFGKRSEVKDSHDKYANASTAFLLQKLEEYQGVIILATNLLQNFDQAFCRRFQFIIEFPFPDEAQRKQIWQSVFPEAMPREELDFEYLAEQFLLSGSQIKSIAVGAAFLAAGSGEILSMIHILKTIKRDMKKSGKNMIAGDFGVYYYLMEDMEGES